MDDFLACELDWRNGSSPTRFGPDEEDPGDLPRSISFDTQNPGGYGTGSVTLARPPWIRAEDAPLFGSARFYGPGGKTRYEGRVKGTPQVSATEIRIEFEGWSAHLTDDETFRFLGVHNDHSGWVGPSVQRKLNMLASAFSPQDATVTQDDTGLPALELTVNGDFPADARGLCEGYLNVEGLPLGAIRHNWKKSATIDTGLAWFWYVQLSDDDVLTTLDSSGNLKAAGPGSGTVTASGTRRYANVQLYFDGATGGEGQWSVFFPALSVFGTHGLTQRALADGRYGLLGSDILRYAIPAGAPLLTVGPDSIADSAFVFPHVVHTSGGVQGLVEYITAYGTASKQLADWGVYDDREFFWKAPGWGRTWRVRRDQVVTPNEDGPVGDERCTGVLVSYTDGAGKTRTVGPPGSGADTETALLEDTDPSNPAARLNGTRRKRKDAGLTFEEGAIFVGQAILEEQNANTRRGSATIQGYATDDAGNEEPACAVRACDRLLIEDEEGVSPELQPINSTSYSHDDLTVNASLGAAPHRVDVLLAELAASIS